MICDAEIDEEAVGRWLTAYSADLLAFVLEVVSTNIEVRPDGGTMCVVVRTTPDRR